ncbi:hypothetical protein RKD48_002113 [Streptomyces ambofaciens]
MTAMQMNEAMEQRRKPTVLEQAGGTKGLVYSALPVVAFMVANSLGGLRTAVVVAGLVAVAITVNRLLHRESVQPALGGLVGVVIAAGFTWYTGSAKDYFLLGIWASLAGAVVFVLSVLVKWPLAGVIWNGATGKGTAWRADRSSRRYFNVATLTLAAIFGARFVVQKYLYDNDEVGSLGAAKIVMGYPLLAVGLLVVAWAAKASDKRLRAAGLLPARKN